MAFPASPVDGQFFNGYRFNINIGAWKKYEYYGMSLDIPGLSAKDILNKEIAQ